MANIILLAGPVEAKLSWSGIPTLVPKFVNACVSTQNQATGVWGHVPPGKFFEIGCSEMASEAFFGASKHHLKSLLQSWQGKQKFDLLHPGNRMKKRRTKPSQCFASHLVQILFQAAPVKNVWLPSCLFSGLCNSLLRSDLEVQGVRAQICVGIDDRVRMDHLSCRRCVCFSPSSEGSATSSQSKHWSGDRRVCQTCSAGPVVDRPRPVTWLQLFSAKVILLW